MFKSTALTSAAIDAIEIFRVDAEDAQVAITRAAVAFDSGSGCICSAEHGERATEEAEAKGVLKGGHCHFTFFFADEAEMILREHFYNTQKISTAMQPGQVIVNAMSPACPKAEVEESRTKKKRAPIRR